jgi:eukaryotic-like serine/threonine-protein kinase
MSHLPLIDALFQRDRSPPGEQVRRPTPARTTHPLTYAEKLSTDRAPSPSNRIGTILGGKYRLDAVIAAGGTSTVYRATHRNQAEFAVKVLNASQALNSDVRARFLREGYAANSVRHGGVVAVVDEDVAADGSVFVVMELLRGLDVEQLCERNGGRLELPFALAVLDGLLDVLEAVHARGIVHRDVKPANLFVTHEGVLKMLDFGIARTRASRGGEDVDPARAGVLLGTPAFMAPEQALGAPWDVDAVTDLWGAGATLFTILSGTTVHETTSAHGLCARLGIQPTRSLASVAREVPDAIVRVVDRALAFDKRDRWSSATAMRRALRDAAARAGLAPLGRNELAMAVAAADPPGGLEDAVACPRRTSAPHDRRGLRRTRRRHLVVIALFVAASVVSGIALRRPSVRENAAPDPTARPAMVAPPSREPQPLLRPFPVAKPARTSSPAAHPLPEERPRPRPSR